MIPSFRPKTNKLTASLYLAISSIQKHQDTALAAFSSNQMGELVEIKVESWCFLLVDIYFIDKTIQSEQILLANRVIFFG
ncbi:hypothetical protein AO382_1964 [Moraxella catarrhalis]|uniref:Uncharacterized protein n=1 Tax=Moraxella catarrhalis TaxID=480 RepID=A0A7Z0UWQ8_MORCA|nr:hypothetical protein AO382_1964 [Moraxella catarrhalis]